MTKLWRIQLQVNYMTKLGQDLNKQYDQIMTEQISFAHGDYDV